MRYRVLALLVVAGGVKAAIVFENREVDFVIGAGVGVLCALLFMLSLGQDAAKEKGEEEEEEEGEAS